jgi:hypothetical protein
VNTPDDAQRDFEQRALRNVRGLVDKMEHVEHDDRRAQRRLLAGLLVAMLAFAVALGLWLAFRGDAPRPVVIDPANLPPLKGGPQERGATPARLPAKAPQ